MSDRKRIFSNAARRYAMLGPQGNSLRSERALGVAEVVASPRKLVSIRSLARYQRGGSSTYSGAMVHRRRRRPAIVGGGPQLCDPIFVDEDVVVGEDHEVAARRVQGTVSRPARP